MRRLLEAAVRMDFRCVWLTPRASWPKKALAHTPPDESGFVFLGDVNSGYLVSFRLGGLYYAKEFGFVGPATVVDVTA